MRLLSGKQSGTCRTFELKLATTMQSSQQHIIARVTEWLAADQATWLCTILKTWGSSPRPVGAMMACTPAGDLVGSISGGCIEEDFLQQLRDGSLRQEFNRQQQPFTVTYGTTSAEQARLRLPCGGQLHVLLEFIQPTGTNQTVFRQLATSLANYQPVRRLVNLQDGTITIAADTAMQAASSASKSAVAAGSPVAAASDVSKPAVAAGTPTQAVSRVGKQTVALGGATEAAARAGLRPATEAVTISHNMLTHRLSPMCQLLLLGAGDVARYVAELALALDYRVTLCDPRPSYLENWQLPGVVTTARLPDEVVQEQFNNPYSGIIALAHDPRVDDMALMAALKTDAFYVGAMGSQRTSAARRARLPELGLSKQEIARLHAPAGFQIQSKTPLEIAIAIMAEVTAVRHGGGGG